jgi:hypothetical protein
MEDRKKLIKFFKTECEANDKNIEEYGNGIVPVCFIIYKNWKVGIIVVRFCDYEEKQLMKRFLMKFIASQEILGYALMFDTIMTIFDEKNKTGVTKEAIIRTLYTSKGILKREIVIHQDKKIIEKMDYAGDMKKCKDEWNLWGEHFDLNDKEEEKINALYQDFKAKNPELYKNLSDKK